MKNKLRKNQSGVAIIILIVATLLVGGGATVAYTKVQESQEEKKLQEQQKAADQKISQLKAESETAKEKNDQADQSKPTEEPAAETSKPAETNPPKPTVTPPKPPAQTTPDSFVACDDYQIAYATKQGGTPLYKAYYSKEVVLVIPYGSALKVKCQDGPDAAALYNGTEGAVRVEDVRKTKP